MSSGPSPACRYAAWAARSVARARQVLLVVKAHRVRGGSRGEDPDRPSSPTGNLLGRHHDGRPPIGERATVVELQRVGDLGAREHLLESDLLTELGLGVKRPMAVVFHRDVGHLLFGGAVLAMWARAMRAKTPGKVSPAGCSKAASEA